MNIFILDKNLSQSVQFYNDWHIRKQGIEACQMLGNIFTLDELKKAPLTQKGEYRKHAHFNHPCSKWVRESKENYIFTFNLAKEIFKEYTYRYDKKHFTSSFLNWIFFNRGIALSRIRKKESTPFILAMPEKYKCDDTIKSYRAYYLGEKKHLFKWTQRKIPYWIKERS